MPEARTGRRFPLHLPITIYQPNTAHVMEGTTGNLSVAGVYIHAQGAFRIGTPVEFEITFPAESVGAKRDVRVRCNGRVVRTEAMMNRAGEDKAGVACVIDHYAFVRS